MTAAEYFRAEGFARLIELCRGKYESLSRIGGSVVLKNATDAERLAIGGLVGRVFDGSEIKLTLKEIDRALRESRFNLGLDVLLNTYFEGEVVTRSERAAAEERERSCFFEKLISECGSEKAAGWLRCMIGRGAFNKRYNADKRQLEQDILIVCRAISMIGKPKLMPIFAAEVSGDPHLLDEDTSCGQLFASAAAYLSGMEHASRSRTLESVGLYSDMVSSFVYCRGVSLYEGETEHQAYRVYNERDEAFTLNIGNLVGIDRAAAVGGRVYIVENPSVFTMLCREVSGKTIICPSGQPKGACMRLLDLLCGSEMYYSGDFDMGGIRIAERLFKSYPNMSPWHYGADDYKSALSQKRLSVTALKRLSEVRDERLKNTANLMIKTGLAGYQENIISLLIKDLI